MKKENNAIVMTSIIAGVILVIAVAALMTFSSFSPSRNTITVQGVASIKALPDIITVYYSIETKGATSAEAKDAEEVIYNKLVSAIETEGFRKDDLKTQSFNIYPNYYWDGVRQREDGYKAVRSLELKLTEEEFDKVSEAIDAGTSAGAGISYINFELTQESQNFYKVQALEMASKDAQTKADAVASGFGKRAGRLVSVQVSEYGYYPWNVYTAKASGSVAQDNEEAREAAMNIAPSEQEISATISATFRI